MFNDVTDQYVIKQYGMPKGKYEKTLIRDKVPFDTRFISLIQKTLRPNKKISVFQVTGLKILVRVGTYIFFYFLFFFLDKNIILFILKCIKVYFFQKT